MRETSKAFPVLKFLLLFCAAGVFLFAEQHHQVTGRKTTIFLASPVRVGGYLLIPNRYQVQHIANGTEHFVLFTKMSSDYTGPVGTGGKEVARVKCTLVPLEEEATDTESRYSAGDSAGEDTLMELVVKGENVRHVF